MLTLSSSFELDIQSQNTFLVPLVVISPDSDSPIYISTNRGIFDVDKFWEDYGLKVDSIKESLDLINKKFKINNLSFTVSNYAVKGERFSDFVSDMALLNKPVEIYYKTQSCLTLDDCLLIYRGNIRRFEHDAKIVKVQLEDLTEDKLSKKVPIAKTGFGKGLYNRDDKNKPIPLVYGKVDRAATIPFISPDTEEGQTDIYVVPDDVLDTSRGIQLEGFIPTEQNQGLYPQEDINPLFLFKDDYYQVLQHYDHSVLQDDIGANAIANWTYVDDNQYSFTNNYISIEKKYTRLSALNSPANNELQTVIRRFPVAMKMLTNPNQSELESDAWTDAVGYGVNFINSTIYAPELSYDNSSLLGETSETTFVSNINTNFSETFSRIPDNTSDLTDHPLTSMVTGLDPVNSYMQNQAAAGSSTRLQYETMSWLLRYAHVHNQDYHNPGLVIIKMPSASYLRAMIQHKLWGMVYAKCIGGTPILINDTPYFIEDYDDIASTGLTYHSILWTSNDGAEKYKINVSCSITPALTRNWFEESGMDASTFDAYIAAGGTNVLGHLFYHYDGNNSFEELVRDGTYFGRDETTKVKYPNLWTQWRITSVFQDFLGYGYASASLKNDSITDYTIGGYRDGTYEYPSIYFDLFDINEYDDNGDAIGGFQDYLFNADDFPQYAPILRTGGVRYGNRCMTDVTFTSMWNGVSHTETPAQGFQTDIIGDNASYFGYWSIGYYHKECHSLTSTLFSGDKGGYFLWVRHAILDDIYEQHSPSAVGEENPYGNAMLQIPKNTLMSANHLTKYSSDHDYDWRGQSWDSHGTELPNDPNYITLLSEAGDDGNSQRLGIVFPFRDLEISDEIKCDTFFSGKIVNIFNQEDTSSSNSKMFQVGIGAIDVIDDSEDFDWDVFDDAFDDDNISLINETLNTCRGASEGIVQYNSFLDVDDSDVSHNSYNGALHPVPEFHQPNNYNAMTLLYKVNKDGANADFAKFITKIYSVGLAQYIIFGAALDSKMYVNIKGRTNTIEDTYTTYQGDFFKYTGIEIIPLENFDSEDQYLSQTSFMTKPCDILYHFIEKELGLIDVVKRSSVEDARLNSRGITCGFSLTEEIKAKELINQVCKDTNLFPLFKGTSEFSFTALKDIYGISDVSSTIKAEELIKYKFTRTPIESVHTILNIKFNRDYAKDEFMSTTGWVDGYDLLGNGDSIVRNEGGYIGYSYDYLGLDREDKVFEIEAPYIRDRAAAEELRDFLFMWNCNQHNIFKLTLPLKYLYLEVGDIVNFNSLIKGLKAYGENYTQTTLRNGQIIYPYFLVSGTNKKGKDVQVDLIQLHNLTPTFSAFVGSITRSRGYYNGVAEAPYYSLEDVEELGLFLTGGLQYYTNNQKRVSDITANGYIDYGDWYSMDLLALNISSVGDFNQDGLVNVIDIVMLVNQILDSGDIDLELFDVNEDGQVNVIDVVLLVNEILSN